MFRIKICGIRGRADEQDAFRFGADAVGLNFCAGSRRYLDDAARKRFAQRPAVGPIRVGVFAHALPDIIRQLVAECRLDAVQLHGEESAEVVAALNPLPVIRAFRSDRDCAELVSSFLEDCGRLQCGLAAVLIDGPSSGSFGGVGQLADWTVARGIRRLSGQVPLILAGGLTCDNVEQAIELVHPFGVDVASGVETSGRKDAELMRRFTQAAKRGLRLH